MRSWAFVARLLGVCLLSLLAVSAAAARTQVGTVLFARGAATAEQDGKARLLGNGTPVYEGDVLTTAKKSFAVVEYSDGTKMNVRPGTVFKVEKFAHDAGEESALLRLFKGGLRTITGLIGERNPQGFQVQMSVATIGIRGTDFLTRICEDDCANEAAQYADEVKGRDPRLDLAGRVSFQQGSLTAVNRLGETRKLAVGAPLYEGDILQTDKGSFAVLALGDDTRLTLKPKTRFQIERHAYDEEAPERGSTLLRLFTGGLRVVTGLIAKSQPAAFKVDTPVATIGIRGTRFDLVCEADCGLEEQATANSGMVPVAMSILENLIPEAHAQGGLTSGLLVIGSEGSVFITDKSTLETFEVSGVQVGQLLPGVFEFLPAPPPGLELGPAPDQIKVDVVEVKDGAVDMQGPEGQVVTVEAGEAASVGEGLTTSVDEENAYEAFGQNQYDFSPDDVDPSGFKTGTDPEATGCEM